MFLFNCARHLTGPVYQIQAENCLLACHAGPAFSAHAAVQPDQILKILSLGDLFLPSGFLVLKNSTDDNLNLVPIFLEVKSYNFPPK